MNLKRNNSYMEMFSDPFLACTVASKQARKLRGNRKDLQDSTLLCCEIYLKSLPKIKYSHILETSCESVLNDILSEIEDDIIYQALVNYISDKDISKDIIKMSTGQQRRLRILINKLEDNLKEVQYGIKLREERNFERRSAEKARTKA